MPPAAAGQSPSSSSGFRIATKLHLPAPFWQRHPADTPKARPPTWLGVLPHKKAKAANCSGSSGGGSPLYISVTPRSDALKPSSVCASDNMMDLNTSEQFASELNQFEAQLLKFQQNRPPSAGQKVKCLPSSSLRPSAPSSSSSSSPSSSSEATLPANNHDEVGRAVAITRPGQTHWVPPDVVQLLFQLHNLQNTTLPQLLRSISLKQLKETVAEVAPLGYISLTKFYEIWHRLVGNHLRLQEKHFERFFQFLPKNKSNLVTDRDLCYGWQILANHGQPEVILRFFYRIWITNTSGYVHLIELQSLATAYEHQETTADRVSAVSHNAQALRTFIAQLPFDPQLSTRLYVRELVERIRGNPTMEQLFYE